MRYDGAERAVEENQVHAQQPYATYGRTRRRLLSSMQDRQTWRDSMKTSHRAGVEGAFVLPISSWARRP
jgi:hypothetical protein